MSTGTTGCFMNISGTIHAVVNWRSRSDKDDVIIGCRLNKGQEETYGRMKDQGYSDPVICDRLFPQALLPKVRQKVSVDIEVLTKPQLVQLIREKLGKPMPSLDKLNADDLRSVLASCSTDRQSA
jgi:hypothetical protein